MGGHGHLSRRAVSLRVLKSDRSTKVLGGKIIGVNISYRVEFEPLPHPSLPILDVYPSSRNPPPTSTLGTTCLSLMRTSWFFYHQMNLPPVSHRVVLKVNVSTTVSSSSELSILQKGVSPSSSLYPIRYSRLGKRVGP